MKIASTLLISLASTLLVAPAAQAASAAISISGETPLTLGNPPFTLGWSFTTTQAFSVAQLGLYDGDLDGFAGSHEIGLWNAAGTLLASATIGQGPSGMLIDQFRYVSIAPLTLAIGTYQIGALFTDGADNLVFSGDAGTVTSLTGVTYGEARYFSGGTLTNPSLSAGSPGYFGPNLTLDPVSGVVPEPATWALMLGGFGLTGFAVRRRRTGIASLA